MSDTGKLMVNDGDAAETAGSGPMIVSMMRPMLFWPSFLKTTVMEAAEKVLDVKR